MGLGFGVAKGIVLGSLGSSQWDFKGFGLGYRKSAAAYSPYSAQAVLGLWGSDVLWSARVGIRVEGFWVSGCTPLHPSVFYCLRGF